MVHYKKWPYVALISGLGALGAWGLRPDAASVDEQRPKTTLDSPDPEPATSTRRRRPLLTRPKSPLVHVARMYESRDVYLARQFILSDVQARIASHKKQTFEKTPMSVEFRLTIAITAKILGEFLPTDVRASEGDPIPSLWLQQANTCVKLTSEAISFAETSGIRDERIPPSIKYAKNAQKRLLTNVIGALKATGQKKELAQFVKKHDKLQKARDIDVAKIKAIPLTAPTPEVFTIVKGRSLQLHELLRRYFAAVIARDASALRKCLDPSGARAKQHLADIAAEFAREKDSGKLVAARFDQESQLRIRKDKKTGFLRVSAVNIQITVIKGGKTVSFRKSQSFRVRKTGKTYRLVVRRDR